MMMILVICMFNVHKTFFFPFERNETKKKIVARRPTVPHIKFKFNNFNRDEWFLMLLCKYCGGFENGQNGRDFVVFYSMTTISHSHSHCFRFYFLLIIKKRVRILLIWKLWYISDEWKTKDILYAIIYKLEKKTGQKIYWKLIPLSGKLFN